MRRLLVPLFALTPVMSPAQDLPLGLTMTGTVELEYLKFGGDENVILNSDGIIAWRGDAGSFTYGVEFQGDGLTGIKEEGDSSNLWLAATLGFGAHEVKIGAPRPALETVVDFPRASTAKLVDVTLGQVFDGYGSALARADDGLVPGLAVSGDISGLRYGVSAHRIDLDSTTEVDVLELAAAWTAGSTTFFGGIDRAEVKGASGALDAFHIGTLYEGGSLSLGLRASRTDLGGDTVNAGQLTAGYAFSEAITLTGSATHLNPGSGASDSAYALGASYTLPNGIYLEGGYSKLEDAEAFDIGLGMAF